MSNLIVSFPDMMADPESKDDDPTTVIPTVPVTDNEEDGTCPVCNEEFDQFFKQDGTDDDDSDGR